MNIDGLTSAGEDAFCIQTGTSVFLGMANEHGLNEYNNAKIEESMRKWSFNRISSVFLANEYIIIKGSNDARI